MTGFALKVKTKSGQQVVKSLTPDSTIGELKLLLSNLSSIPVEKLSILSGFPPKLLDLKSETECLKYSGISSGDTLILEERLMDVAKPEKKCTEEKRPEARHHTMQERLDAPGILMKHVVPADNSCLFTSIYFVLNGKVDDSSNVAPGMRQIISETVARDPEMFSEAILGRPNSEYCKWIQDDKSWGGAIEISILSNYYGVEIAVVDTINAIINRFGEDKDYALRVFLMFDGIHYDPLFLEPLSGGDIQTIFSKDDDRILQEAEQLAVEAKSSRQYTDVNKFTLKCMVCDVRLNGQLQAQQHAQSTGHTNFGEI